MPLRLSNTLTKKLEEFVPRDPGSVSFYTCGPTVYDDAHIGNFRSFLAADLLRRWIESPLCEVADGKGGTHKGPRTVTHVMNITDVGHMTDDDDADGAGEDKMEQAAKRLAEAKKSGKIPAGVTVDPNDPYQVARFYEGRFREDARSLGLKLAIEAEKDPSLMPRATENVQGMIALVQRLIEKGNAYAVGAPGSRVVYFRIKSFPGYGRLSGNTLDKLKEGEGGRIDASHQSQKEHPADFLLWKEDPRHIMKWESPWGWGYPGWHIECSVMSAARLCAKEGTPRASVGPLTPESLSALSIPNAKPIIDLHSGGEDNIFPHHECELAQSCCAFNADPADAPYAAMWFHPRFLMVEGAKMSKSKGNFYTARDLFAKGIEPGALRLELIKTHYRSNANFTMQGLTDSQRMIDRWRRIGDLTIAHGDPSPATREALDAFAASMNDDLNIAGAIAALNTWSSKLDRPSSGDVAAMRTFDNVLGVLSLERAKATSSEIGIFLGGLAPDPLVIAKLEDRRAARAAKDFKKSDQIRDDLLAMGYAIKDAPGGKVEVSRK
ncbi:MAG: cysteine--tRNA ligase [Planctomycetes bacterium]|nr:cysteine--tRNA ligase [Planctomycetota bacterium]